MTDVDMEAKVEDTPKETTPAPENTTPAPTAAAAAPAAPPAPPNPDVEAYKQHWQTVQEDPLDFSTWTTLLTVADRLEDTERLRAAYDAFLAEYPLCYGYWKKYADAEARHGNTEHAVHVYERGVAATPYSADLWAHYAAYKKSLPGANPDEVRGIYERGVAYVATDYNSHTLWDKYFAFEQEQGSTLHIASLYCRVLACPIKELDRYYTSFKNYIHPLAASQVVLPDHYEAFRAKLEAEKAAALKEKQEKEKAEAAAAAAAEAEAKAKAEAEAAAVKAEGDGAEEAPPGAEEPPVKKEGGEGEAEVKAEAEANGDQPMADVKQEGGEQEKEGAEVKAEGEGQVKKEEEGQQQAVTVGDDEIKVLWVRQQDELYDRTKAELLKRKPFEDAVRRPYFHVKPLDGVQLWNWIRYLDATEAGADHAAIVTLFERCLVACANYPEFWQRYVRYLERADPASARPTLDRAVLGFCKRRPEMHLFAAHYDERHGDVEGARARYKHVLSAVAPRLLEAVTAAANFERRQGNMEAACSYLQDLLQEEKSREGSRIYPFLAIHYAHFIRRHSGDVEGGRKVLDDALKQCPSVRSLWEAAVHFEEHVGGPESVARALKLYDTCTGEAPEGTPSGTKWLLERDREELSARAVDYADMYGTKEQVAEAAARHAKRFMLPTSVTAEARAAASGGKRTADGAAGGAPAAKAVKAEASTPVAAATPAAAIPPPPMMPASAPAAAAGYGYPPAPPAAAAAAYSSYYGYGQYPAAPQYPGYGAYPGYGY